jgi:cyclohexanecarboxylate-CoA ligase
MPDPVMVERACAFIVPRGDVPPTLEDLASDLDEDGVARQKIPE